jgi:site-specific DNA-methyltransferase (adenine-specific)
VSETGWRVVLGDCAKTLRELPEASVDAVVTDPPYGLSQEPDVAEVLRHWLAGDDYKHRGGGFMGRSWDSFVPGPATWKAVYRVLKPGGFLLCFAGTRTADLMGISLRLAGFEIRDRVLCLGGGDAAELGPELAWVYGSG